MMKVNFFEEFPNKENLDKLKLIKFPIDLVIAAESLDEFYGLRDKIKKKYKNVEKIIYWPILNDKEGYWFSAFSKKQGLERISGELKQEKEELTVLWDAELPILNKSLFLINPIRFFENKNLINKFLKNAEKYNKKIILCENIFENWFSDLFLKFSAVRFNNLGYKKIAMAYSSMFKRNLKEFFVENQIKIGKQRYKGEFSIGLGVIAKGKADEPILTPADLENDLKTCKKYGIKEVYIFRLGGLNKEYVKVFNNLRI